MLATNFAGGVPFFAHRLGVLNTKKKVYALRVHYFKKNRVAAGVSS